MGSNVMQNERMVNQVVVRPHGPTAEVHIDQVDGPSGPLPVNGDTLHLGSQDLIRFAGYATSENFHLVGFLISDAYFEQLPEEEQDELSDEMVAILTKFGSDELEDAMSDDYSGLFIIGVELVSKETGLRLVVRRSGYVETSIVDVAERLIDAAWRKLQLS